MVTNASFQVSKLDYTKMVRNYKRKTERGYGLSAEKIIQGAELMKEKGVSLREAAKALNIDKSALSHCMQDGRLPRGYNYNWGQLRQMQGSRKLPLAACMKQSDWLTLGYCYTTYLTILC